MPQLKFELRRSGYCTSQLNHALAGAATKTIRFYATWAYIYHPTKGHILFDTGYTRRFYNATRSFPANIYAKATPAYIKKEEEACFQLKQAGIGAADISYIIISHFHADHVAGLKDFPNAKFIASEAAYYDVRGKTGFSATRRAFLPDLLPSDFESRLDLIDIESGKKSNDHLGKLLDLFDDGSILLCDLTGHAKGQLGALLNTEKGKTLLAADAAWLKENFENLNLPTQLVRLFFDSWSDYKQSLKKVHDFYKANPGVDVIPCHCLETFEKLGVE